MTAGVLLRDPNGPHGWRGLQILAGTYTQASFAVLMARSRSRSVVPNIDGLHSLFIEAVRFDLDGREIKSKCLAENLVGLLQYCR